MAEILKAVLMGVVEGATEFIPVSSTGHLILFGRALKFTGDSAATFEVFIQLGAILAVVWLYSQRFLQLLPGYGDRETGFSGWNGIGKLFFACLPAFVLGFLFHEVIKSYLFASLPVALALISGGIVMIALERTGRESSTGSLEEISYRQALGVGVFQCCALWPGISRSGSTIVGGMLLGLDRRLAAEFSFLVAVPVMFAAVGYDLLRSWHLLSVSDIPVFLVGFIVSFVTGILAIKFFLSLLARYTLEVFGWYRIVVGVVVLVILAFSS